MVSYLFSGKIICGTFLRFTMKVYCPDGVSCLPLLRAIRFFDDTILLDPCGYVPLGWESLEACTCGDSSSGMDFSLCSVGCQVSFLGRRPWGLTHF